MGFMEKSVIVKGPDQDLKIVALFDGEIARSCVSRAFFHYLMMRFYGDNYRDQAEIHGEFGIPEEIVTVKLEYEIGKESFKDEFAVIDDIENLMIIREPAYADENVVLHRDEAGVFFDYKKPFIRLATPADRSSDP